jgi:acetyltransferase EpsM
MAAAKAPAEAADRRRAVTSRELVVIGAGEHARVVIEAARGSAAWDILGVVDRDLTGAVPAPLGVARLGDDAAFEVRLRSLDPADRPSIILGMAGTPGSDVRRRLAARYGDLARWATVCHPTAWISPSAVIGPGSVVLAGAIVNSGARVGAHAIVNSRAIVEHDVVLDDFVHVAPGAVLGGGVRVDAGAFVGLGALVRDHIAIGAEAIVGMGAIVVADVPANATVLSPRVRRVRLS